MLDQKVSRLSGGERARLLLARLLLLGATVLLLDEPTNDLDLLTLRVLEEALLTYDGSVVVVTHDRAFLDRVCTGVLAFESDANGPRVQRYASRLQHVRAMAARVPSAVAPTAARTKSPRVRKGLSFKEQKELEGLPARIEASETEPRVVTERLSDPRTYKESPDGIAALQLRIEALPNEIEALYARWAELSERHEA
jgi:ATP-binding cassette subfamily F protein uup